MSRVAVFLSPISRNRRTVAIRHERPEADALRLHAGTLEQLHRATCGIERGTLTIYLCRGWGQLHGSTELLTALVTVLDAHVVDEWGRTEPEFAPKPRTLPVLTPAGLRDIASRASAPTHRITT